MFQVAALRSDEAVGFVGLGKMGLNMVTRLIRGGHQVVAFDRSADAVARAAAAGATGVATLEALVAALAPPRAVWVMVPAGAPTESTVASLGRLLAADDTIIDGGNTNFHDDVRRAETLAPRSDRTTSTRARAAASGACRKATA